MANSNKYVVGTIVGLNGLFLTVNMAVNPITRMPATLGITHLLLQEQIAVPLGPLVLAATLFQLAYCVLGICLVCLASLVCLANYLFRTRSA
jgi:hypothetical protein